MKDDSTCPVASRLSTSYNRGLAPRARWSLLWWGGGGGEDDRRGGSTAPFFVAGISVVVVVADAVYALSTDGVQGTQTSARTPPPPSLPHTYVFVNTPSPPPATTPRSPPHKTKHKTQNETQKGWQQRRGKEHDRGAAEPLLHAEPR